MSQYDSDIQELIQHKLDQENRFTKLEGRVTTVESTGDRIEKKVDGLIESVGKWAMGLIVTLGIFTLGLIVTLVQVATRSH